MRLTIILLLILPFENLLALSPMEDERYVVFDSLLSLSWDLIQKDDFTSASQAIQEAETMTNVIANPEYQAKLFFHKGYIYDLNGEFDLALSNYQLAKRSYEELGQTQSVFRCMNFEASVYYFAGDFENAIRSYILSIEFAESNELQEEALTALINLGVTYRVTDRSKKALETYFRSLELAKILPDSNLVAAAYHNIGVALTFDTSYTENFSTAIMYLDSAFAIYSSRNDTLEMSRTANAFGDAYYKEGKDMGQARSYLLTAEQLQVNMRKQDIISNTYLGLGRVEMEMKNFEKSNYYFEKGLDVIDETGRSEIQLDFYESYSDLLYEIGDHKESRNYLKKYQTLREEQNSQDKSDAIERLQVQYETSQKENELQLSKSRNANQRIRFRALGIGSLFLLGFVGVLYRLYGKLKLQNSIIAKALKDKDTLLREIHHRVKNNLQLVSGLLNLQSDHVQDATALRALKDSEVRVQSIALLHQDLYQKENLRDINTEEYLERLIQNLKETYDTDRRNVNFHTNIQSIILDVDSMIPMGLIVNELITNSIKHAFGDGEGGEIHVILGEDNDMLELKIRDNGKTENKIELNDASFGYSLIQSFAMRLDADMDIQYDNGLNVTLRIKNYRKPNSQIA